jgi:hypothetical protein
MVDLREMRSGDGDGVADGEGEMLRADLAHRTSRKSRRGRDGNRDVPVPPAHGADAAPGSRRRLEVGQTEARRRPAPLEASPGEHEEYSSRFPGEQGKLGIGRDLEAVAPARVARRVDELELEAATEARRENNFLAADESSASGWPECGAARAPRRAE